MLFPRENDTKVVAASPGRRAKRSTGALLLLLRSGTGWLSGRANRSDDHLDTMILQTYEVNSFVDKKDRVKVAA